VCLWSAGSVTVNQIVENGRNVDFISHSFPFFSHWVCLLPAASRLLSEEKLLICLVSLQCFVAASRRSLSTEVMSVDTTSKFTVGQGKQYEAVGIVVDVSGDGKPHPFHQRLNEAVKHGS
jgi:hypothetical protein